MAQALLVVDVQCGFINAFTHHIPQRIVRLIEREQYNHLLFTRFINVSEGPYQKLLSWHSCSDEPDTKIVPELEDLVKTGQVFAKEGLCGLPSELCNYLHQQEIKTIAVVGIDTDMCVLKIAMDLFDMGIEPIVLTDCCASTAGLQAHLAGLAVLSRNIGANRLQDAGLSEGLLAAPAPNSQ